MRRAQGQYPTAWSETSVRAAVVNRLGSADQTREVVRLPLVPCSYQSFFTRRTDRLFANLAVEQVPSLPLVGPRPRE
jgi:hypothetical protein